jgi:H+/Cl- antiporter ClcA
MSAQTFYISRKPSNHKEESMDWIKTLSKSILGLFTGAAAVAVLAVAQALSSYNPVICSETVVENCTPQFVASAWLAVVPAVSAFLVGIANWLKHRND